MIILFAEWDLMITESNFQRKRKTMGKVFHILFLFLLTLEAYLPPSEYNTELSWLPFDVS